MNKGTCKHCGKPLAARNALKYCSRECFQSAIKKKEVHIICERCGKDFIPISSNKQRYCSRGCARNSRGEPKPKVVKTGLNRPFTAETRYLIRLWHSKGDSKEKIAEVLGRSLESVEQAFV